MKITNSEEVTEYYKIVNNLIDQYIQKWKIKPTSLKSYLKPGTPKFESFVLKNGLSDVEGIKRIIQDVIDDRSHMELDGILKFESFINGVNESSTIGVAKADIQHEKVLADLYNTSLGHIEPIDLEKHIYEVSDFGDKLKCIIYSDDEVKEIESKLAEDAYNSFCKKSLIVDNNIPYLYLSAESIISEDKFKKEYKEKLNDSNLIKMISNMIDAKYKQKFKGYHIWNL
jgi:hypothetical protein